MITALLLAGTVAAMTLDEAVDRVRRGRDADAAAMQVEAERLKDGGIVVDDLRLSLEHRSVDQFATPRLDDLGVPLEPTDNLSIALQVPLPKLEDLVGRGAVDHTARAEQALLADERLQLARDVARDASAYIGLRQEVALVTREVQLASALFKLQTDRREGQLVTAADVDDAHRELLRATAEAVDIDDDLDRARRKVIAALGSDDVEDDLEAVCLRPLPALQAVVDDAVATSPRREAAREMRQAVDGEDLAWKLGYLPWPSAVQGTFINRDRFSIDDYRLRLDFNIPLLRFLDTSGAGIELRQRAVAAEESVTDQTLRLDVGALREAAERRQLLVQTMTLPPTPPTPTDPAEALESQLGALEAKRRRARAVGRCAAAVVELDVLRGRR